MVLYPLLFCFLPLALHRCVYCTVYNVQCTLRIGRTFVLLDIKHEVRCYLQTSRARKRARENREDGGRERAAAAQQRHMHTAVQYNAVDANFILLSRSNSTTLRYGHCTAHSAEYLPALICFLSLTQCEDLATTATRATLECSKAQRARYYMYCSVWYCAMHFFLSLLFGGRANFV